MGVTQVTSPSNGSSKAYFSQDVLSNKMECLQRTVIQLLLWVKPVDCAIEWVAVERLAATCTDVPWSILVESMVSATLSAAVVNNRDIQSSIIAGLGFVWPWSCRVSYWSGWAIGGGHRDQKLQLYCNTSDGRIFIMEVYVKIHYFSRELNIGYVFFFTIINCV